MLSEAQTTVFVCRPAAAVACVTCPRRRAAPDRSRGASASSCCLEMDPRYVTQHRLPYSCRVQSALRMAKYGCTFHSERCTAVCNLHAFSRHECSTSCKRTGQKHHTEAARTKTNANRQRGAVAIQTLRLGRTEAHAK